MRGQQIKPFSSGAVAHEQQSVGRVAARSVVSGRTEEALVHSVVDHADVVTSEVLRDAAGGEMADGDDAVGAGKGAGDIVFEFQVVVEALPEAFATCIGRVEH